MYKKKKSSIKCCWRQQNLEKYTFGLLQESNTYCTVKVYKIGAKHCCDVTRTVLSPVTDRSLQDIHTAVEALARPQPAGHTLNLQSDRSELRHQLTSCAQAARKPQIDLDFCKENGVSSAFQFMSNRMLTGRSFLPLSTFRAKPMRWAWALLCISTFEVTHDFKSKSKTVKWPFLEDWTKTTWLSCKKSRQSSVVLWITPQFKKK